MYYRTLDFLNRRTNQLKRSTNFVVRAILSHIIAKLEEFAPSFLERGLKTTILKICTIGQNYLVTDTDSYSGYE